MGIRRNQPTDKIRTKTMKNEIKNDTNLYFTEVKLGGVRETSYTITAGEYIQTIYDHLAYAFSEYSVPVAFDNDGEPDGWEDTFYDLPIFNQLDACIKAESGAKASRIRYEISND